MHLFDFLRRMFPAAIPPAEPAPRKGRDGSPSRPKKKAKKPSAATPKKKASDKKK